MFKYFLETLLEAVDVIVNQMLLVDLGLVDEADQGQTLVHFSEVEHDILLVVGMC